MAEIELEDAQTGNRTDNFYPIWARAEHRWYPSGRFAAYNEYIKENLPDLTVKYAPGVSQTSCGSSRGRDRSGWGPQHMPAHLTPWPASWGGT